MPEGYTKSLAQYGEHLGLQNEPYLGLADRVFHYSIQQDLVELQATTTRIQWHYGDPHFCRSNQCFCSDPRGI